MSKEARKYVEKHSPFTGLTFWVHFGLGDNANPSNGYEILIGNKRLAEEWRVSIRSVERAISELRASGYLTKVANRGPGRPVRYRFEFKNAEHMARKPPESSLEPRASRSSGRASDK